MLDPIADLLAGLLAWFYSLVPSYGFAITALTTLVLLALSPLTYKSTKSMVAMRRVQPEVRRLQKKHKGDRETLNQEMMALYQKHKVSPLSGCLPILVQSPVFIMMFQVIKGITRRRSTIGFDGAQGAILEGIGVLNPQDVWTKPEIRSFNPAFLDESSDLYRSLINHTEMLSLGLDLSESPLDAFRESFTTSIPYLAMVALVAFLGWYQQKQLQGRMTGEVSAQQQMIMRILPWMLPIFSFTMPAGLILYFIVSAVLRILQQAYLTRAVYGDEELTKPLDFNRDDDEDDEDEDDDEDDGPPENPLAALFGGGARTNQAPSQRHGSRRPVTSAPAAKRSRPASSKPKPPAASSRTTPKKSAATPRQDVPVTEKPTGWGRAKRSASTPNDEVNKPVSRRITPKGDSATNRRDKKQ